ncbi:MAG: hypothetical protein ACJ75Z_13990 [Solirubrobacterales bacterium]
MRQHCAQCLTQILANGRQAPTGETLCAACYAALWGTRQNGDRLASNGRRPRSRQPSPPPASRGRSSHWLGPIFELEPSGAAPAESP